MRTISSLLDVIVSKVPTEMDYDKFIELLECHLLLEKCSVHYFLPTYQKDDILISDYAAD